MGDHLGSTTLLVDTSAPPQVAQRQYYTAYGEQAFAYTANSSLTSVNFTGQRLDSGSGLLYYGARYYDPQLSYFLAADTIASDHGKPQSGDRYSYVLNNPLGHTDPTGHCASDFPKCSEEGKEAAIAADTAQLTALGFILQESCPYCLKFTLEDLEVMLAGIEALMQVAGWTSSEEFKSHTGTDTNPVTIQVVDNRGMERTTPCVGNVPGCTSGSTVSFNHQIFEENESSSPRYAFLAAEETFVHEFAHAWSYIHLQRTGTSLADAMFDYTHYRVELPTGHDVYRDRDTPVSIYGAHSGKDGAQYIPGEDWAEAVAATTFHDVDSRPDTYKLYS